MKIDKLIEQYTILAEETFKRKDLSLLRRIQPYTILYHLVVQKAQNIINYEK